MTYHAQAWVLCADGLDGSQKPRLVQEEIALSDLEENEVLAAPIYGCWEGNMSHAIRSDPLDICRYRGENRVVIGNAGVVRVVKTGSQVRSVKAGQYAMVFPCGVEDRWGYMKEALGYDAAGRHGMLSTLVKLTTRQLIPIPKNSHYSLAQWAAFSVRYVTAWSNWELAYGVFRLQLPLQECPAPHVWGWGGGTTLAEIDLAKRFGCQVVMLSGTDRNLDTISRFGITAIDRRRFGNLSFDQRQYRDNPEYRAQYDKAEELFLQDVHRATGGEMVQIFLDYVGGPVYRATTKALARESVLATAGWKGGLTVTHLRAKECIGRHQHVHTHYARYSQGEQAVQFAEDTGWMPPPPERIYKFDQIPELASDYLDNKTGYFPCYSVNPEMAEAGELENSPATFASASA